ncbi:P-type DNA transfer ATPase VirB11, partial [Xanthomonas hortorum pv. pelargonii]|nr:P-type DNA transfer ATPase VirB11 [Xanthomonas hortorum pv. pelargonii]
MNERVVTTIEDSPLARISNDFLDYQYSVLGILDYLNSPEVTE